MKLESRKGIQWRWVVVAGALVSGPLLAQTVDADIEAVQLRLDAARKAQSDREAAKAAQSRMGTLVIKADRDCALSVNGQAKGKLTAEQTTTVTVQAGEQLIECFADDRQRVEVSERVPAGEQVVVRLAVRLLERFSAAADGVRDDDQNLIWASADNGGNTNWGDAQRYCAARGGGWALPTVAQLQALYDASGTLRQSCAGFTCNVTPLIRLSGAFFWSSELNDPSEARDLRLQSGDEDKWRVDDARYHRALCVRRP